ncbi:MAG: flagellar type III secretion system protein FliR [Deltaproteobacteria bacterium]|nr:flagellar type III secretion system protein FliR [Deltaproteobacteria bacterium]
MASISVPIYQIQLFALILVRVGAIIVTIPFFDSRNIPMVFKIGLSLAVGILLFPLVAADDPGRCGTALPFCMAIISNIGVGVIIGLSVKVFFAGVQLAGQLVGFQMGFSIANVMDTLTSSQASIIAQVYNFIAVLIFFVVNGHHWFLRAIVQSFRSVSLYGINFGGPLREEMMRLSSDIFVIAIKVGAPVMVALLVTSVAFGLLARTVPQMNIFIVAFPLKIVVGILVLGISLPVFASFLREEFSVLGRELVVLLRMM